MLFISQVLCPGVEGMEAKISFFTVLTSVFIALTVATSSLIVAFLTGVFATLTMVNVFKAE